MMREEFEKLAEQVAAELGTLRGETWTVGEGFGLREYSLLLNGPGQAQLHMSMYWTGVGKVSLTGCYPEGVYGGRESFQANVDPARGPLIIAKEANRRVIAAGYVDALLVALARKAEQDQRTAERASWLAKAAELFGVDPPDGDRGEPHKLYLGKFVQGSGYAESYQNGLDTGHMSINLSGVPAQVALDMLAVLARHVAAECKCCRMYGPGHHPDLAMIGCLRQRSGRGEESSRMRVREILHAHGVTGDTATSALDEARVASGYRVSVIERGDQVLAVVTWDHQGCGEFTVELAKSKGTSS